MWQISFHHDVCTTRSRNNLDHQFKPMGDKIAGALMIFTTQI
tara:strand:+ start:30737 stop:30862 length:126 start_codon:yes stop_codon:yes gene_type:complete